VEVEWGTGVVGLEGGGSDRWAVATADDERLEAGVVVGADGLRSRVRRWAGLETEDRRKSPVEDAPAARFGVRRHYRVPAGELPRVVEVWWAEGCEAYVTPVGPEEVGVAMLWSGRKASFDALLAGFPALARRFVGRPVVSDDRGAGPLLQRVRGVVRGDPAAGGGAVALVGDAGGYVDAITGEGLSLAFAQAEALVAAVVAGDLPAYAAAHRRLGRVPNTLTRLLLAVERRPPLRRRAIRALAAEPALFSLLLAIHARQRPATAFFPAGAARLAWRLASPAD
jgi:flavin-dependent dehydrogenase